MIDAVRAVRISKRYGRGPSAVTALDDVSVSIAAGRLTAVLGPSGSGKSTLLHCLSGLDTVDTGSVPLAAKPAVVFADEPTGNLDSAASTDVLRLLRSCVDELGQTVVLMTHDPVAAGHADRAILLADGRIVDDRPAP